MTRAMFALSAIMIATICFHSRATAQISSVQPLGFGIEGTWDLDVTFVDCTTGMALAPSSRSLVSYVTGGTYVEEPSSVAPSRRYPGLGVWRHVRARNYALAFKSFQFNADGTSNGKIVVTANTTHNQDDTLTSYAVARFFNAAGDMTATRCVSVSGTRFTGEQ